MGAYISLMNSETEADSLTQEEANWRDHAEEKEYQIALGEMLMNAGYAETSGHDLNWAMRSLDRQSGVAATGRMNFSQLRRETVRWADESLPERLRDLVRFSFEKAAPLMKQRNELAHALWVSSLPRIRLTTRESRPRVVELAEIERLAFELMAAGFQFGVARTQVLRSQGKLPIEEDLRDLVFLDDQLDQPDQV